MREIFVGRPIQGGELQWLVQAVAEIENASREGVFNVADAFTIENFTETRTLDASTATVADLANFVATFIDDLQKRGSKRVD
jgi:hypothetical protein